MKIYRILISAILLAGLTSCGDDWDNHYNESSIVSDKTEVYQGDIVSFVKSQSNLKKINSIFEANNSYCNISTDK